MSTPSQYREKAAEYAKLFKNASGSDERHEFHALEQSFTTLADNGQWLADNHDKTVRSTEQIDGAALAQEEEQILRYLGAALIMQWNTLPQKLRRELFDNAGAMDELLETPEFRRKLARSLHKHKNGDDQSHDHNSRSQK
jgi:hypothetical protein